MKTFKMYVKTVIYNEQEKILLLNRKREDNKPSWDLPGATFTEEQSFDETIINNVQKEIGYYVYPGKIIGIADYSENDEKEVNVIMEGTILNGELLLSRDYETYTWVPLDRISDYPLAPWLSDYIKHNKNPFKDAEAEFEEITSKKQRRRSFIQEDIRSNISSGNNSEKKEKGGRSSFGLLKDTIIRTFHPQEAKVTQTTPKSNQIYQEDTNEDNEGIADKLNFRFRKDVEEEEKYLSEVISKESENDIIIEHDDNDSDTEENKEKIIVSNDDVVEESNTKTENIKEKFASTNKKLFDMNINKEHNMKDSVKKIKKVIKKESRPKEPEIKIIHSDEQTPRIRTEKESKEKVSFNSENIERSGWKERLNRINRTEANNEKKEAPRPKGQRK